MKKDNRLTGFRSEKGAALAVTLMTLMVLAILSVPFINLSFSEQKTAIREEQSTRAYYIGLAGADMAVKRIMKDSSKALGLVNAGPSDDITFGGGTFKLQYSSVGGKLSVNSVGTYNNTKKTVRIDMVATDAAGLYDYSLFSDANLNLSPMDTVTGPLASNGKVTLGDVNRGEYARIIPSDYLGKKCDEPSFPTTLTYKGSITGTATISQNGSYDQIDLVNGKLTFNTNGGDLKIMVNDISLKCDIEVLGTGVVELYVNKSYTKKTNDDLMMGHEYQMMIFMKKDSTFNLTTGQAEFRGYVYGPFAKANLESNSNFKGAMIIGTFDGKANANVTYIPYAENHDISSTVLEYRVDTYQ